MKKEDILNVVQRRYTSSVADKRILKAETVVCVSIENVRETERI